jgi:hypothetical protein
VKLHLPAEQANVLVEALTHARTNEVGGQIYGQQLAASDFRITDITLQRKSGTFARFVVDLVQAARDAFAFFERTRHSYPQYNYIGEWHSHPSFAVQPSTTDVAAMRSVVQDTAFKGNFAVLMIAKLDDAGLHCGGWLFDPRGREEPVTIEFDP